jgi:predicted alpha/beta superfamily hydrolase
MGTVQIIRRHITPFGLDRNIHLYLPEGWSLGRERYPVLYMYDGHNLFFDRMATYGKSWGMKEVLDRWPRKLIVVGIECNHEGDQRLQEFCPYPVHIPGFLDTVGTGADLMDWVEGSLKPEIDRLYPTLPDRANTAIGGSSMGGLMSLFTVCRYNRTFSKAACLSSMLTGTQAHLEREIQQAQIDPDTRVYLSWGSHEGPDQDTLTLSTSQNLQLNHLLTQQGATTYPYLHPGGRHCEADWEQEVPRFLRFLWGD